MAPGTAPDPAKSRTPQRVDERFAFEPHNCFACGALNAHGLHLELHVDGERCWTDLSIPARFQGWDEIAHGGIVATILDEVMAWSLVDHDNWGLTARMSVDFKRPVPLGRPIHAEGWVTEVRRRLITTEGQILDTETGQVLATAEATYVAAPEDRKRELKERYGYRPIEGVQA
jgi:uncharacterized protein (TIGR00369 family)